ncbi:MAG: hypothetical protein ABW159_04930 [Candidatus Thiodiazotropha sp.]
MTGNQNADPVAVQAEPAERAAFGLSNRAQLIEFIHPILVVLSESSWHFENLCSYDLLNRF